MKLRLFGPSAQEAPPGSCRGGCIRQVGPVRPVAVGGSLSGPVNCTARESTVSTLNTCCCTAPQLEPSGADWLATRPVHLPVGRGLSRDRASSHIYSVIHCTHAPSLVPTHLPVLLYSLLLNPPLVNPIRGQKIDDDSCLVTFFFASRFLLHLISD